MVVFGRAESKAGALRRQIAHLAVGTSIRGCSLGKENDAFCLLSWEINALGKQAAPKRRVEAAVTSF